MKTSIEVDEEIWKRARVLAAARGKSLSQAVNDAIKEWIARGMAELEGIAEWARSEIREENEPEVAKRVRDVQQRTYERQHVEMKGRPKRRTKKGGERR